MADPFNQSTAAQAHVGADTDSSFDALHHTIGKGATNAAAGNHKHKYADLADVPDGTPPPTPPDLSGYVAKVGDQIMTGVLQINNPMGLQLHYSGDSVVSMMPRLEGGVYTMYFLGGWDLAADAPLHIGYPLIAEHAARADWVSNNFSPAGHDHGIAIPPPDVHGSIRGPNTIPGNSNNTGYTYPHGLGQVPTAVIVQPLDDTGVQSIVVSITTWDATNVSFRVRNIASGAETVRWSIIAART
jgi:hypothetical protein